MGVFPGLCPLYEVPAGIAADGDQVTMGTAILITMIAVAGLMMLLFGASPQKAVRGAAARPRT
jgi:hypothetical protein